MKSTLDPIHWKSHAWWPEECCPTIGNYSDDTHATKEEAVGVCNLLHRNGFGGAGKFFPIRTEVVPIYATPDPTNVSELAREVASAEILSHYLRYSEGTPKLGNAVQSALSKLAAEKDAEIANLRRMLTGDNEGALLISDLTEDAKEYRSDLARHVAALKVARDALELVRARTEGRVAVLGCEAIRDSTAAALQRIDKELKP